MSDHPTKNIVIQRADVDILIAPLVQWMNQQKQITTLYACQGNDKSPRPEKPKPYIVFIAETMGSLISIARPLHNFLELYTPGLPGQVMDRDESDIKLSIRYSDNVFPLRFDNQEIMLMFSRYVCRGHKPTPKIQEPFVVAPARI